MFIYMCFVIPYLLKERFHFTNILSSINFRYFDVSRKDVFFLKEIRIYNRKLFIISAQK